MKTLLLLTALLATPAFALTNQLIRIELTGGERYEGRLLEERAQELVVEVALAGGTIFKTETFARTNVVAYAAVTAEELAARAEAAAYAATRRYSLNPSTSYPAEYYSNVITNVFRAFLAQHPNSPHAEEVAGWLSQWQAEHRQVIAGLAKYQGQWLPAAEAGARLRAAEGDRLLAQARQLASRGQYERAIDTIRPLPGDDVRQFGRDTARQWITTLETTRNNLHAQITQAEQNLGAANAQRQAASQPTNLAQRNSPGGFAGPTRAELIAKNRATAAAVAAQQQLDQLRPQFATVENDLARANAAARQFEPRDAAANKRLAQAGPVEDGASENPALLGQIADFFAQYWLYAAGILLVALWYFSRRFNN